LVGVHDFKDFWSLRSWLFGWMLRILTNAFAWVLLGRVIGSESRVQYLLIGNAVAAGSAAALWASNATTWSRFDGTHPLLVIAPKGLLAATVGRTSVWMLNGIATSLLAFTVLILAFGYRPASPWALLTIPLVVLVCASSFAFALFMGVLLSNRIKYRNLALDIGGTCMMAFCGAAVPVSFWPLWLQRLVQLLPMTHGLAAIRGLLEVGPGRETLLQAGLEAGVGFAWLSLALLSMSRLFDQGRADGSIELS
jgi:ABC-2 type transport system permease protein